MRILLLHCDYLRYKTTKPALRNPPDPEGEYDSGGPVVAVFASIEEGDAAETVGRAAEEIVRYAREMVGEEKIILYPYAHLSSRLAKPGKAHRLLVKLEARLREKGLEVHRAPFGWYKRFELAVKGHPLSELSREI